MTFKWLYSISLYISKQIVTNYNKIYQAGPRIKI